MRIVVEAPCEHGETADCDRWESHRPENRADAQVCPGGSRRVLNPGEFVLIKKVEGRWPELPCITCGGGGTVGEAQDYATEHLGCSDCRGTGRIPNHFTEDLLNALCGSTNTSTEGIIGAVADALEKHLPSEVQPYSLRLAESALEEIANRLADAVLRKVAEHIGEER